jgi:hypothetical protein
MSVDVRSPSASAGCVYASRVGAGVDAEADGSVRRALNLPRRPPPREGWD